MPTDTVGWASSGIYRFWDYETREILYIGLAIDLPTRFKQHNGIIKARDIDCKYQQINSYFGKSETIVLLKPLLFQRPARMLTNK